MRSTAEEGPRHRLYADVRLPADLWPGHAKLPMRSTSVQFAGGPSWELNTRSVTRRLISDLQAAVGRVVSRLGECHDVQLEDQLKAAVRYVWRDA
jgi:hypothetical protein